jgi:hypothetical protein
MSSQEHVIKKLIFEIEVASQEAGREAQEMISNAWRSSIYKELERWLDSLSTSREVISIDKLEIDLGSLGMDLERQLPEKAKEMIGEKLREVIDAACISGSGEVMNGNERTTVTFRSADTSRLELLAHFIQTGTFPWWARNEEASIQKVLAELILNDPAQLKAELVKLLRTTNHRTRFIYQLSDELIVSSISLYDNTFASFALETVRYIRELQNTSALALRTSTALRRDTWDYFLRCITISSTGSSEEQKAMHLAELVPQLTAAPRALSTLSQKAREINSPGMTAFVKLLDTARLFTDSEDRIENIEEISSERRSKEDISEAERKRSKESEAKRSKEAEAKRSKEAEAKRSKEAGTERSEESSKKNEDQERSEKRTGAGDTDEDVAWDDNHTSALIEQLKKIFITIGNTAASEEQKTFRLATMIAKLGKDTKQLFMLAERTREVHMSGIPGLAHLLSAAKLMIEKGDIKPVHEVSSASKKEADKKADILEQMKKVFDNYESDITSAMAEGIYIGNAGIILVWPYLSAFFTKLGMMNDNKFIDDEAAHRAVHILQYLVTGEEAPAEEHELVLNKLLCGIDPSEPLSMEFIISEEERTECDNLLHAIVTNWTALKKSSVAALRGAFLKKEGLLTKQASWNVKIERQAVDMLIDKLPWSISIIKLPWCKDLIYCEW